MDEEPLECDFCGIENRILTTYDDSSVPPGVNERKTINLCKLCENLTPLTIKNKPNEIFAMMVGFNYLADLINEALEGEK